MRIFIGIPFNDIIIKYLVEAQNVLLINAIKYNKTLSKNFHLTLAFIGDVDITTLEIIKNLITENILDNHKKPIYFDQPKLFSKDKNNILYISIKDREKYLEKLSLKIKNILNINNIKYSSSHFSPHITLARKVNFINTNQDLKITPFQDPIFIEKIVIYKSEIIENKLTYTPIKIISKEKDKL